MKLRLRDVAVDFRAPSGARLPALGPITFDVEDGEFVCIVGPSGCGKSTLIRTLAGLQRVTSGAVLADDESPTDASSAIAIMFQDTNLMPWRTVRENIALPLELRGMPKVQRNQVVERLLPHLRLEAFAHAYPAELSGGMAQRVALGRVIVQRPRLWLLDEPFGALDALTRERLCLELLGVWRASNQTVVMVTHNISEAVLMADRVLVLSSRPGQLVADIPIDLPRPRRLDAIYDESFVRLARAVRSAIENSIAIDERDPAPLN